MLINNSMCFYLLANIEIQVQCRPAPNTVPLSISELRIGQDDSCSTAEVGGLYTSFNTCGNYD